MYQYHIIYYNIVSFNIYCHHIVYIYIYITVYCIHNIEDYVATVFKFYIGPITLQRAADSTFAALGQGLRPMSRAGIPSVKGPTLSHRLPRTTPPQELKGLVFWVLQEGVRHHRDMEEPPAPCLCTYPVFLKLQHATLKDSGSWPARCPEEVQAICWNGLVLGISRYPFWFRRPSRRRRRLKAAEKAIIFSSSS